MVGKEIDGALGEGVATAGGGAGGSGWVMGKGRGADQLGCLVWVGSRVVSGFGTVSEANG